MIERPENNIRLQIIIPDLANEKQFKILNREKEDKESIENKKTLFLEKEKLILNI